MSPDACNLASEHDRQWFERHPDRQYRIRFMMPDELPGLEADPDFYTFVAVGQAMPGRRLRVAFASASIGEFDETTAREMFEAVAPEGMLDQMRRIRA
jgi:hypothetical protein